MRRVSVTSVASPLGSGARRPSGLATRPKGGTTNSAGATLAGIRRGSKRPASSSSKASVPNSVGADAEAAMSDAPGVLERVAADSDYGLMQTDQIGATSGAADTFAASQCAEDDVAERADVSCAELPPERRGGMHNSCASSPARTPVSSPPVEPRRNSRNSVRFGPAVDLSPQGIASQTRFGNFRNGTKSTSSLSTQTLEAPSEDVCLEEKALAKEDLLEHSQSEVAEAVDLVRVNMSCFLDHDGSEAPPLRSTSQFTAVDQHELDERQISIDSVSSCYVLDDGALSAAPDTVQGEIQRLQDKMRDLEASLSSTNREIEQTTSEFSCNTTNHAPVIDTLASSIGPAPGPAPVTICEDAEPSTPPPEADVGGISSCAEDCSIRVNANLPEATVGGARVSAQNCRIMVNAPLAAAEQVVEVSGTSVTPVKAGPSVPINSHCPASACVLGGADTPSSATTVLPLGSASAPTSPWRPELARAANGHVLPSHPGMGCGGKGGDGSRVVYSQPNRLSSAGSAGNGSQCLGGHRVASPQPNVIAVAPPSSRGGSVVVWQCTLAPEAQPAALDRRRSEHFGSPHLQARVSASARGCSLESRPGTSAWQRQVSVPAMARRRSASPVCMMQQGAWPQPLGRGMPLPAAEVRPTSSGIPVFPRCMLRSPSPNSQRWVVSLHSPTTMTSPATATPVGHPWQCINAPVVNAAASPCGSSPSHTSRFPHEVCEMTPRGVQCPRGASPWTVRQRSPVVAHRSSLPAVAPSIACGTVISGRRVSSPVAKPRAQDVFHHAEFQQTQRARPRVEGPGQVQVRPDAAVRRVSINIAASPSRPGFTSQDCRISLSPPAAQATQPAKKLDAVDVAFGSARNEANVAGPAPESLQRVPDPGKLVTGLPAAPASTQAVASQTMETSPLPAHKELVPAPATPIVAIALGQSPSLMPAPACGSTGSSVAGTPAALMGQRFALTTPGGCSATGAATPPTVCTTPCNKVSTAASPTMTVAPAG